MQHKQVVHHLVMMEHLEFFCLAHWNGYTTEHQCTADYGMRVAVLVDHKKWTAPITWCTYPTFVIIIRRRECRPGGVILIVWWLSHCVVASSPLCVGFISIQVPRHYQRHSGQSHSEGTWLSASGRRPVLCLVSNVYKLQ
ncbi:hypothetical protein Btru_045814 [Bulinus truncatus]|nr:hypothetical protein Btru_045814 [Bulinus truncatus]